MELIDNWDRPDGELGNDWIDAHREHPTWWDEFELRNQAPVLPNPDRGLIVQPDNAAGRAAFYKDFGPGAESDVAVSIVWSGLYPLEATPLLHVNPDADEFGLGAWPFAASGDMLIGTVGRRPDQFSIIQRVRFGHVNEMHRRLELRSRDNAFSVWISVRDVRSTFNDDLAFRRDISRELISTDTGLMMMKIGLDYPIPESLRGSTMHGAAVDVNQDFTRAPYRPLIVGPCRVTSL